jgi:hypothetical protein
MLMISFKGLKIGMKRLVIKTTLPAIRVPLVSDEV